MPLELTDPSFLSELERLRFTAQLFLPGRLAGIKASPHRGSSQEFKDYRTYVLGDELRFLDWNVYARLSRPYLKLFRAEEEIDAYLLLDLSGSMGWGDPPKHHTALRVAAGLAYLLLAGEDRVGLLTRQGEGYRVIPPARGLSALFPFFRQLETLNPTGPSLLQQDFKKLLAAVKRRSLLFILSDFFMEEGYEAPLGLISGKHRAAVIQVVHPEELHPSLEGNMTLLDVESSEKRDVSVTADLLKRYTHLVGSWNAGLSLYCKRHAIGYVRAEAGEPVIDILVRLVSLPAWRQRGKS